MTNSEIGTSRKKNNTETANIQNTKLWVETCSPGTNHAKTVRWCKSYN